MQKNDINSVAVVQPLSLAPTCWQFFDWNEEPPLNSAGYERIFLRISNTWGHRSRLLRYRINASDWRSPL